jgi:xylulokinase
MAYLMGIDIGSTSIKAVIYDYQGKMISKGIRPTVLSHLDEDHPSWAVWEPDKIWNAISYAVKQALSNIKDNSLVKAVAVTGFGMDGLPLDKNGKELFPLISWHCPRTKPQADKFSELVGAKEIFSETGKQVMIIDSIYRMIWMKENHPEILKKTDKWLLIEDYINFKLCGEKATDYSMASCTSVFKQNTHTWADKLIKEADIPLDIFPKPQQSGTPLGNITNQASDSTGLSCDTMVVLGGHDYICASLAVGAVSKDVVMDVTGTWEMVVQPSEELILTDEVFSSGYYIESHVAKNRYCFVGSTVSADMLEWFKTNYAYEELKAEKEKGINVWQSLMDKAKASPPGANGCFFLPHFSGAGAPHHDSNSLGGFIGLSNIVSKPDMIRAMIEGLNYQFRDMIESLETALLNKTEKIIAVGGGTNNKFWMQNKADITGKVIEVPDVYEATPLGAALLAGIGIGIYNDENDAIRGTYRSGITYKPDLKLTKKYDEYFNEIYKKLYRSLIDVNKEIVNRFR